MEGRPASDEQQGAAGPGAPAASSGGIGGDAGLAPGTGLVAADDFPHYELAEGDPWWTETYWFPVYVPDEGMAGYFYSFLRLNLKVGGGGVILWDESSDLPWQALHFNYQWCQPLRSAPANHVALPGGWDLEVLRPLMDYRFTYQNDADGIGAELEFQAVHPPRVPGQGGYKRGHGGAHRGHIDQVGHIEGTLTLGSRRVAVDCFSIRDRTWSTRPDDALRWWGDYVSYTTASAARASFQLHCTQAEQGATRDFTVFDGFARWDGVEAPVETGARTVERTGQRPSRISLSFADGLGRRWEVVGIPRNRIVFQPLPTMMGTVSMMHWVVQSITDASGQAMAGAAGATLGGEDQDMWATSSFLRWSRHALVR